MFVRAYLDTAADILARYSGEEPLTHFLKKYFAQHKKFGARDRRQISHLCYCYFRMGHSLAQQTTDQKILCGLFLCSATPQPVLAQLKPEWNEIISLPLDQKIGLLQQHGFRQNEIFPFTDSLAPDIDAELFTRSILIQPDIFLRIRPGKKQKVLARLREAGSLFDLCGESCIALAPGAKLDDILMLDADAVVQDKSSQQVLSLLAPMMPERDRPFEVWDCCAASGGKSILFKDMYPACRLTVSDIRSSIIANLQKRFKAAGISNYHSFVGDVAAPDFSMRKHFDVVLCDAPCSGSGTWSRTPEQMYFFKKEKISYYAGLQQKIAVRAAQQVKRGGHFLYITCSVFEAENEAVVAHIAASGMQLKTMQYFKGYDQKSDTLFAAVFNRS
jgi:16S rRNA (cytosine967-C5)-methyltransferase